MLTHTFTHRLCRLVQFTCLCFIVSPMLTWAESEPAPLPQDNARLPLESLRTFTEVFKNIKAAYVEEISDEELLESAIRGMLDGLDPHSAYLTEKDYESLQTSTSGKFGGLGIEVSMDDGLLRVVSPIDDTPAQKAGIKANDLIIQLDDKPIKGMKLMNAIDMMRGEKGSEITLKILRENVGEPLSFTLVRDFIKIKSVKTKIIDENFGYVRVSQFQAKTGEELAEALSNMKKNNPALKGIVLDLRNNPGGILQASVAVVDVFMDKEALVVYTKGRLENAELRFSTRADAIFPDIPLIVLINGGSASASEIVAGALQDHKRAIIAGTNSFGKGSVQTVMPLSEDKAIKLTTARYYTPNGTSIQARGIVPDIYIEAADIKTKEESLYKEADLSGHLSNGNGKKDKTSEDLSKTDAFIVAKTDFQLYEALNILKAASIFKSQLKSE